MTAVPEYDPCAASAELSKRNDLAIAQLQAQGMAVDVASLLSVRVAHLLDTVLGPMYVDGEPNLVRGEFELQLQQSYATMIADAQGQAARAKLLNGVHLRNPN